MVISTYSVHVLHGELLNLLVYLDGFLAGEPPGDALAQEFLDAEDEGQVRPVQVPLLRLLHLLHRDVQRARQQLQVRLQTLFYQLLVAEYELAVQVNAPVLQGLATLHLELPLHLPYPLDVLPLVEQLDNGLIFEAAALVEFHADFIKDLYSNKIFKCTLDLIVQLEVWPGIIVLDTLLPVWESGRGEATCPGRVVSDTGPACAGPEAIPVVLKVKLKVHILQSILKYCMASFSLGHRFSCVTTLIVIPLKLSRSRIFFVQPPKHRALASVIGLLRESAIFCVLASVRPQLLLLELILGIDLLSVAATGRALARLRARCLADSIKSFTQARHHWERIPQL